MKKYNVTITETLQKTVTVEAENSEKAEVIARGNYENEKEGYVLTADDYNDTQFTICEVETNSDKFSYKDKIAAASVAKRILDTENMILGYEENSFTIQHIENDWSYDYRCPTLMQVLDCLDGVLGDSFLSGKFEDNFERMIYIILNSDFITDILSTIDVDFYKENCVEIDYYKFDKVSDDEYYHEKYLINKSIAQKVIGTQSAYLMTEYEDKIYVSEYAVYDDCENGMQSFMADIIEYNDDKIIDPPFDIFDDYADIIKREMQQIKDDYVDLGKDNFYLSFEEIAYIGNLKD